MATQLPMSDMGKTRTFDAMPDSDSYAEFQQFKRFQALFQSEPNRVHYPKPSHLENPTYNAWNLENDREFHGFLSRQFPTIANPSPLGLCAFALTTWVLSMYNVGAWVPSEGPNGVVWGVALFYGGLVQLLAGMWEMKIGNTFGALAFSSYGGFWMGTAALFMNCFGFLDTYTGTDELNNALGIYWFAWCLFTTFMCIASHRTSIALFLLFFFLALTFLLLTIAQFLVDANVHIAAGAFGILTACIAWYAAFAGLLDKRQQSLFSLPVGDLKAMFPTREERAEMEARQRQRALEEGHKVDARTVIGTEHQA